MAELRITIGALSASVEDTNARATKMLTAYSAAIGASGTNQQKAAQVLKSLVRHMREVNVQHLSVQAQVEATAALQEELSDLYWGDAPVPSDDP